MILCKLQTLLIWEEVQMQLVKHLYPMTDMAVFLLRGLVKNSDNVNAITVMESGGIV